MKSIERQWKKQLSFHHGAAVIDLVDTSDDGMMQVMASGCQGVDGLVFGSM